MCGICCVFYKQDDLQTFNKNEFDYTKKLLQNRGPDGYKEIEINLFSEWCGFFAGSTLWTQGSSVKIQPQISASGSIFLWNGDNYPKTSSSSSLNEHNDAEEVFSNVLKHGVQYLTNINGPYAFIYYNSEEKELWFGRDVFGRHSLILSATNDTIYISSVGLPHFREKNVSEVPYYGLCKISFSTSNFCLNIYPWFHIRIPEKINIGVPFLFQDCFKHRSLCSRFVEVLPQSEPEESEIIKYCGSGFSKEVRNEIYQSALEKPHFMKIVEKLEHLLFSSVESRIKTKPNYCKNCLNTQVFCTHSKIGILFSGGLDSAILALISNKFIDENEPIDLYNVSFQRSKNHKFCDVPDRINGLNTLEELKSLCPNRVWNFVEIDISQNELDQERERHISKLIYPLTSVLDDSLGCALWFAARGKGLLNGTLYDSPTRVVLLGMGADEMFGGYTKHRKAFASSGWKGLGKELCETLNQIGERNMGRDNRVVADHGRTSRTPYLDEELVSFVNKLPPWQRCFLPPHLPVGVGDKFILRLLAWKLGLKQAAFLPKKALQFGSHIANPKEKGHLDSDKLTQLQVRNCISQSVV